MRVRVRFVSIGLWLVSVLLSVLLWSCGVEAITRHGEGLQVELVQGYCSAVNIHTSYTTKSAPCLDRHVKLCSSVSTIGAHHHISVCTEISE